MFNAGAERGQQNKIKWTSRHVPLKAALRLHCRFRRGTLFNRNHFFNLLFHWVPHLSFFSVLHWVGAKWGWGQPLIYLTKDWREGADGCQGEKERHSKTDDLELHSEMFQVIVTSHTIHILSAPINYSLQRAAEQELWASRSVRRTINDDLLGSCNKTSDDH